MMRRLQQDINQAKKLTRTPLLQNYLLLQFFEPSNLAHHIYLIKITDINSNTDCEFLT